MRRINKKGDILIENVLEVIVAVICIGLIIYFVYYLYQNSVNREKVVAKQVIDSIMDRVEILKDGESGVITVQGPCTSEECPWFLAAYSKNQVNKLPKCLDKGCLCICKEGVDCQSGGYCRATPTNEIILNKGKNQFAPNPLEQNDYTRFKLGSNFKSVEAFREGEVLNIYVLD